MKISLMHSWRIELVFSCVVANQENRFNTGKLVVALMVWVTRAGLTMTPVRVLPPNNNAQAHLLKLMNSFRFRRVERPSFISRCERPERATWTVQRVQPQGPHYLSAHWRPISTNWLPERPAWPWADLACPTWHKVKCCRCRCVSDMCSTHTIVAPARRRPTTKTGQRLGLSFFFKNYWIWPKLCVIVNSMQFISKCMRY